MSWEKFESATCVADKSDVAVQAATHAKNAVELTAKEDYGRAAREAKIAYSLLLELSDEENGR